MASHLMRNLLDKGYQTVEDIWILADNRPPQNLARRFQAAPGPNSSCFAAALPELDERAQNPQGGLLLPDYVRLKY